MMHKPVPCAVRLAGLLSCLLAAGTSAAHEPAPSPKHASLDAQARAFDFLMGTWSVQNRSLAQRLQHSHEWLKFRSTASESPLRTGTGNLEYYTTNHWPDFVGMALRLYDPKTGGWRIYWSDNRFSRGVLQPPLTGSFQGGRGVFEGADHFNGIPIVVRYTWRSFDHDHARWSQAFSRDKGATWETNWIMDFTRIAEDAHASTPAGALRSAPR
ncbi:MAG TPA: hypothetical protein VIC29_10675 [Steroidobacteraceae bacterium]